MKKPARLLAVWVLMLATTIYIKVRSMTTTLLFWGPKLMALAAAPLLMVAGGFAALMGLLRRDKWTAASGLLGAGLAANYIRRVSAPQPTFTQAFGPDWEARITPGPYMLPDRWQPSLPDVPEPRWQWDVDFWPMVGGHDLLCDLWQPPQDVAPSGLGIIYLHGSGWHYADKDFGTRPMFRQLAAQGHVVMDVSYRLAPGVTWREMVGDVKRAIAWLKQHADRYGVDPDRIVLAGGSAGGHLALLAGYTPNHAELDPADLNGADTTIYGVVAAYPVVDLFAAHDFTTGHYGYDGRGVSELDWALLKVADVLIPNRGMSLDQMIRGFIGGPPAQHHADYTLASPMTHVGPHCPPTLLLQGEHDAGIDAGAVQCLARQLKAENVPVAYVEYPYTDHGFDVLFTELAPPAMQAALYDTERFLALLPTLHTRTQ
jgi:acetyl esterase/lipase